MCNHEWKKHKIERTVAGRTEKFFGEKCSICGDVAWTANSEKKYREWIKELVKSEAFKIQNIKLSAHSVRAIATIRNDLPVDTDAAVIKGCIGFYLSDMMHNQMWSSVAVEALKSTDQSPGKSSNLKVSPLLYLKLESLAKLSEQSVKELVEDIVNLVLSKIPAYYQALENQIATAA